MKKGLIRGFKGLCCMALAAAITLTGIQVPSFHGQNRSTVKVAEAASTTSRVPMWAYMKSGSGRLTTYTTNALNRSTGYIVPGDYCKISAFYSNGSVKVTYPTSKGSRTAYASMSGFMASTGFTTRTRTLGRNLTAYRRSTGGATIGTVYASDQVIVVGTANGRTQVQYPCSGGYKLGWVSGTYSANTANAGVVPQGCVDSVTSPSTGKITVAGWAFDRDSLGSSLQIHVYVGGPAGSGAPGYPITANAYRPDVNKVYPGVGNNHGFHATLSVPKRGNQTVYIYAINVGGGSTNPLLAAKSVNIKGAVTSSPASNTSAQISLNVPSYKQYDGRWRYTYIGNKTIGNIGCLLTSLSMKYSYHTHTATYPNTMKWKLAFSNNDLIWSSVTSLGYSITNNYNSYITNSMMSTIYSKLREGKPVIIGGQRSSTSMHWVVITGYRGTSTSSFNSSNFTIHDPNSSTRTTLNLFLNTYPVVLRLVY